MRLSTSFLPITNIPKAFRYAWPIPYATETNGGTPTVYTRAQYIASDVASLSLLMRNAYQNGGVGSALTSNVALYASNGSGVATGSPLLNVTGATIPGDGTDYNSGATAIIRGGDGKIVHLMSLAAGATVSCYVTPSVHGVYNSGTATVNPPPSGGTSDPTPICWVHFDCFTARRRIIFITDSIGAGVNSATGFEIAFPYQLGVAKDYAVMQMSLPGSALSQWADFGATSAAWWADGKFTGSDVWLQPGVNDVAGGSASTMFANLTTIFNHCVSLGANRIYTQTIAPNSSVNEGTRLAYNTLVLANTLGAAGVADFASRQNVGGLADNTTTSQLFSSYDSGDHLHWSDAGHTQAAALCEALVG